ncbi:MAG: tetratricopeptide repeat protein [Anaerolinea sp.]|nr:tetratricopeptide repeat protein [Anaerolinea sp.]
MSQPSELKRWQDMLRQQKQVNAWQWLTRIETAADLPELVKQEYDNLLRVLENTIEDDETFDLAFTLIQKLHPFVVGYADWDRWLTYLQRALTHSQKLERSQQHARLLELVSDMSYLAGDWTQAKSLYDDSLKAYEQLGDLHGSVSTLTRLSAIYASQGKTQEAIGTGSRAVQIAELTTNPTMVAHSKLALSQIYYHAKFVEQSLTFSKEAFALGEQLGMIDLVDKALLNIVACEISLAHWEEATQAAKVLEESVAKSGDIRMLSQVRNNLGIIYFQKGEYLAAERAWDDVLQLHSQMQYPAEAAAIHNNLGKVYTKLGEWGTAEQMLLEAVQVYDSLGDLVQWTNTMDNLADLYEAWGKTAVFQHTLQQAITRLSLVQDSSLILELRATMQQRLTASS